MNLILLEYHVKMNNFIIEMFQYFCQKLRNPINENQGIYDFKIFQSVNCHSSASKDVSTLNMAKEGIRCFIVSEIHF